MRIPRTNFPIKSDEYGFEDDFGEQPIRESDPLAGSAAPSLPSRSAPAGYSNPQYEPVVVRRPAIPPVQNRPAPLAARPNRPEQMNVDPSSAPISKRMFSLSENVRFTRTPDSELLKGKLEPMDNAHGQASITPQKPVPVAVPRPPITLPKAPSAPVPPKTPVATQTGSAMVRRKVPVRATSPFTFVSDHAFFESIDFAGDMAPIAVAIPPKSKPNAQFNPDEITARFRVVECKKHPVTEEAPKPQLSAPPLDPMPVEPEMTAALPRTEPETIDTIDAGPPAHADPGPVDTPRPAVARRRDIAPAQPPLPPRQFAIANPIDAWSSHGGYEKPAVTLLQEAVTQDTVTISQETLEQNAGLLESVLEDFGIRGEIIHVRPGPVVTLYEFEPAPGVKSSRVIGLADDIARSMSALSARVAVVPGRNVIGIELPNTTRETVYLREMVASDNFDKTKFKLALCLGKTIGGEPVIAELAKMPHLLVAGTTGSGKSVAINTMILSLLYRLTPDECRLIMVDPKMLELSIYDGIPHLLTPVVTDPKKAVMALKWAVREMEDRYRKMSKLGVRNIDGFNARVSSAQEKGETVLCTVQTGFDKGTGEAQYEQEAMDLTPMPYIVIIVDEMADLMMVAGKEIEGAIQRLAQMARAAGIHLIMATQRPSVDVITGTIKANFPTRISFQVTSKIDSRTILGEQGAEQLLGQGDMLHMIGGGRISRVHGPFVSDEEVEKVVAHLKAQGQPDYLDTVTADESEEEEPESDDGAVFDKSGMAAEDGNELYDQAVKVILRDKKCSTSYIQRRLQIGYNRAASLVERMEKEGLVGPANHVGKREILTGNSAD
ncbi:DNA translocase FtsK [Phyllobacterium brassicacearum]|nr:DNA translocase FtsK [Phyllobacterium brassicacearum]TDQ20871.1 DNA translocase FtsK [Phyllobacterium brassicacearum]